MLLQSFIVHLERRFPVDLKGKRVLVAVSGGVDSMVLAHLLRSAGIDIGLAHFNYQLRGADSEADAALVQETASHWELPFFSKTFPLKQYLAERGGSLQLEARNLRYEWLEQIRQEKGFDYIATAHHLEDALETMLQHFMRGAGLKGLTGIPPVNGLIIRPLLFAAREDIERYARDSHLVWREDASNATDDYDRNRIRHQVLPVLKDLNANWRETVLQNFQQLSETAEVFDWAIAHLRQQGFTSLGNGVYRIDPAVCPQPGMWPTLLFEWLRPFGFGSTQVADICRTEHQSGALWYSAGWELLKDRTQFFLRKKENDPSEAVYYLGQEQKELCVPGGSFSRMEASPNLAKDRRTACLDAGSLNWPLVVRKWRAGDWFCPLGMQGKRQKLQDFFTHQKMTRFEKEQVWILQSGADICWVAGHRLDERFKVSEGTTQIVCLEWKPARVDKPH